MEDRQGILLNGVWIAEGAPWLDWTEGIEPIKVGLTRTVNLKRWWGWLSAQPGRRPQKERAACLTWTLATGWLWRPLEESGRFRMMVADGWTHPRMELRVGDLGPEWTVWAAVHGSRKLGRILGLAARETISAAPVRTLGPIRRIVLDKWNLSTGTTSQSWHIA